MHMKRNTFIIIIILSLCFSINSSGCVNWHETNNKATNVKSSPQDKQTNQSTETNKDYIKMYDSMITDWKSALADFNNENYGNSKLSFDFYDMDLSEPAKAYYAIYDIDSNGTPELILRKVSPNEDIIAYIFTIKDGKIIDIFGNDELGELQEVPWSRAGSSTILSNGLIDSTEGGYTIYKIDEDGCSVIEFASGEPYDYPDEAHLADAKWRYYVNNAEVDYDSYVKYLKENGYSVGEDNTLATINWIILN